MPYIGAKHTDGWCGRTGIEVPAGALGEGVTISLGVYDTLPSLPAGDKKVFQNYPLSILKDNGCLFLFNCCPSLPSIYGPSSSLRASGVKVCTGKKQRDSLSIPRC